MKIGKVEVEKALHKKLLSHCMDPLNKERDLELARYILLEKQQRNLFKIYLQEVSVLHKF